MPPVDATLPRPAAAAAAEGAILDVRGLRVSYGGVHAVREVSFAVPRDAACALVGPNGAGKTSCLEALAGFRRAAGGEAHVAGRSLRGADARERIELGLSLVPEGWGVLTELSVAENLHLFGACAPASAAERAWEVERVEELFPALAERREIEAGRLSGGERQMLSIACALRQGPLCLMLDEPTIGLSPVMADTVWDACAALRREGISLLIVAQEVERVLQFVDHVLVMQSGALTLDAPCDAATVARCHELLGFGQA